MNKIHGSTGLRNSLQPGVVVQVLLDAGVPLVAKQSVLTDFLATLTTLHHREAVARGGLPFLERPTDG